MAVVIVLVVVLLAVVGGVLMARRTRTTEAEAEAEGTGPNELLESPPTSFPSHDDETDDDLAARFNAPGARSTGLVDLAKPMAADRPVFHLEQPTVAEPAVEPEPAASEVEPAAESTVEPEPEPLGAEAEPVVELAAEIEAEPETAVAEPDPDPEPLVAEAEVLDPDSADAVGEPVPDENGPTEEPAVADAEPDTDPVVAETTPEVVSDDVVIDLVDEPESAPAEPATNGAQSHGALTNGAAVETNGSASKWSEGMLQPEPDAVDHVLQALITRARFKQVDVEEVASELVERADLQGVEVSEVLAELVGRADGEGKAVDRTSELTLFNDAVPSRPGQLTDFAQLAPADKKRIIVRVLCLLVARSEDQQLPPREEPDGAAPKSWPLARAVWPLAATGADADAQLPSRRLAQSS